MTKKNSVSNCKNSLSLANYLLIVKSFNSEFSWKDYMFPAESLRQGEWTFSETYEFIQKPTSSKEPKTQQTSAYKHNI